MRIIGLTGSLFLALLLWSNISSAAPDADLKAILSGHAEDYVQSSRLSAPFSASVERIVSGDLRVRPRVSSLAWEELLPVAIAYAAFTQYEDAPRQESLLIGAVDKLRGVSQSADLHADILGIVVADRCQRVGRQGCLDPFRRRHGNVVAFMEAREKNGAPVQAFHLDTKQLERAKRLSMPFYEAYSELLKALSEADWNGDTQNMMGTLVQAESHFGKSDPITWAVYRNVYALAMAGKLHPDPVASKSLALSLARDRLEENEYQSASSLTRKALEKDAVNAFYHIYKAEVGKKVDGNACLMGPKVVCRVAVYNRAPAADDPRVPLSGEELAPELVLAFKDAVSQRRTVPWLAALKMATVDLSLRMVGDQRFDEAASLVSEVVDVVTKATWMDQDLALHIMVAVSDSCDSGFEEECLVSLKGRQPQLFLRAEDWRFEVGGDYTPERHQEMANAYVERNMAWGAIRHYPRLVLAVIEVYGASSPEAGTGISNYQKLCEAAPGACDQELGKEIERIRSVRIAFARRAVDELRLDPGPGSQQYLAALAKLCDVTSSGACDKAQRAELGRLTASLVSSAITAALEKQREDARSKTSESHVWGPVGWLVGKAASRSERVLLPVPNLSPEEMARWLSFRLEALEKARKDYHWEVDDDDGYGSATFHEISGDLSRFVEGAQWLFPPADTLAASKQDPWADWQGQIEAGAKLAESGKIEGAVALYAGGLARLQAVFPDFDGPLPDVMTRLGDWEFKLGRHDKSLYYRLQVLSIHEGHSGDVLQQIASLEAVADSLRALGRGSDADSYVQKAAAIRTAQRARIREALRSASRGAWQGDTIRVELDRLVSEGSNLVVPAGWVAPLVEELMGAYEYAAAAKLAELHFSAAWKEGFAWPGSERERAVALYMDTMGRAANDLFALGAYAEGLQFRQRLASFFQSMMGAEDRHTLQAYESLAMGYFKAGRMSDAALLLEQAIDVAKREFGEKDEQVANALGNLVVVYNGLGRHREAVALAEQLHQQELESDGASSAEIPFLANSVGYSYYRLGQPQNAVALQEAALAAERASSGDLSPTTHLLMRNLAYTYKALGRYKDAKALESIVLAYRRVVHGEQHPDTLKIKADMAATLAGLGDQDGARELLDNIVPLVEALRASPSLGVVDRQSAFSGYVPYYRLYARLLSDAGKLDKAFHQAELSKARTLLESSALRYASRARVLPADEQERLDSTERAIREVDDELAKVGADIPSRLKLEARRGDLQRAYAALQSDLKARFPRYAQLVDVNVVGVKDGAALLSEDALMLSFLPADRGWLVFALDRAGVLTVHSLADEDTSRLADLIGQYRAGLAVGHSGLVQSSRGLARQQASTRTDESLAAELGTLLLGPVQERIAHYRQLIISPDGILATLPFEAMAVGGEPLIARHDITYTQSLSVYALLRARGDEYSRLQGRRPIFAMGNPIYAQGREDAPASAGKSSLKRAFEHGGIESPSRAYRHLQLQWPDLPGTARELAAVENIYGIKSLQRSDASEITLRELDRSGELSKYKYLLFSSHGYLNLQEPSLSALVLSQAPDGLDAASDGYISASEWPSYNLKSDLLVLSACETALGAQAAGEGVMGLPYALYVAGNRTTLLTLWQIDDAASAEFIERFFRKLKEGQDQVRALNETKREFLQDERLSNPRYWAPFVMYGA